jgi:hypothetical protein
LTVDAGTHAVTSARRLQCENRNAIPAIVGSDEADLSVIGSDLPDVSHANDE